MVECPCSQTAAFCKIDSLWPKFGALEVATNQPILHIILVFHDRQTLSPELAPTCLWAETTNFCGHNFMLGMSLISHTLVCIARHIVSRQPNYSPQSTPRCLWSLGQGYLLLWPQVRGRGARKRKLVLKWGQVKTF